MSIRCKIDEELERLADWRLAEFNEKSLNLTNLPIRASANLNGAE